MIDFDRQLKLQAFLDGELPEAEAREIAVWIAQDAEAAGLHAELNNTRRALGVAERGITLPETREFYWSKIRRDIERAEAVRPAAAPALSGWQLLIRWIKPVSVVATVLCIGVLVWLQMAPNSAGLVSAQLDEDVMTFQDQASGTTFVWFNYPAENDVANETLPTTFE